MFVITIRSLYLNFNQRSKLKIGRAIARVLLRILVFILIALAIIPVALLPVSTTVPPSIQILFAMAEVALLTEMFRLGFTVRVVFAELAGFVAIASLPFSPRNYSCLYRPFSMSTASLFLTALRY